MLPENSSKFRCNVGDEMGDEAHFENGPTKRSGKPLTAAFVRNARAPGKYHDGNGLILRIETSGAKRWIQRIVIRGKRTEIGLGSAKLVSLTEARDLAIDNRRIARNGGDPLQAKRQEQQVPSFENAARTVHKLHAPTWTNSKHAAQFLSTLETYAFPYFGQRRISDVNSADIMAALSPIWLDKPETARRVRQRIGTVLKWAIAQRWRQDNPTDAITKALPKQDGLRTHRKALPYQQVAQCIASVWGSNGGMTTKLAFEFIVLTACRSGEARLATWDEIDCEKAEWCIPAHRMKTKRQHRVPLTNRAIEVLLEASRFRDSSDLVFPGGRKRKPLSDMTISKLVKSLGYDADVHGFRTSFRMWVQEQTHYPREIAEAALAHSLKDKSEAAYARSDFVEKRRSMMEAWANFLERDCSPKEFFR